MKERDVFFYVQRAIERSGSKSERALCALMGLSPSAIASWRRSTFPSDETMVHLAQIAGVDPFVALIDLNYWRSTGQAKTAYSQLLKKITIAVAAIVFCGLLAIGNPAYAKALPSPAPIAEKCCNMAKIVYIMVNNI